MTEPSTMSLVHFSTSFSFSSGMFLVLSTLRRASSWMKTQRCELQSAWARTDPLTPLAGVEHKKKKGEAGYYNKSENSKGQPKGMMQLTVQNTFQWSCIKLKIDSCILVAWVLLLRSERDSLWTCFSGFPAAPSSLPGTSPENKIDQFFIFQVEGKSN